MSITLKIDGAFGDITGNFDLKFLRIVSLLSGKKKWKAAGWVIVDASGDNIRILKDAIPDIKIVDTSGDLASMEAMRGYSSQADEVEAPRTTYTPKRKLAKFQEKILAISWERKVYAILLDMGLRKTGTTIANVGMLFFAGKVTGMFILAPKGVHSQWILESFVKDADPNLPYRAQIWMPGKKFELKDKKEGVLEVLSMNIDSVKSRKGFEIMHEFLDRHEGKSFMVLDESDMIKESASNRSDKIFELKEKAEYRRILTGTLISRDITDAWNQFMFLDERILGHRYKGSFQNRFTTRGGPNGRLTVGARNVEEFYSLIAPHSFRATKDELLDLPPKNYVPRPYDLDPAIRERYDELKETLLTQLDNGEIVDAKNGAVALMRLQQLICGYLPQEDGTIVHLSDQRIEETLTILRAITGKVIIWSRFTEDTNLLKRAIEKEFGDGICTTYVGGDSDKNRSQNKERFIKGDANYFLSNPAAGGVGVDGLQGICHNVIYYSNSFNARHRWQSEDRSHRDGMIIDGVYNSVSYFDLIAKGTCDRRILKNLRDKKELSDLALDDIRRAIAGDETDDD